MSPQQKQTWISLIERWQGARIMVLGDLCLDEYVSGAVYRISPEAPVPVVEVKEEGWRVGMAANVADNVAKLGGQPFLFSVVGNDRSGELLLDQCKQQGISTDLIVTDPERPTTRKTRVLATSHHLLRIDYETRKEIAESVVKELCLRMYDLLPKMNAVVVQDYAKGVVSQKLFDEVKIRANALGIPILVDPHRSVPLERYSGSSLIKPNLQESLVLTGQRPETFVETNENVQEVVTEIQNRLEVAKVVVTRGSMGMSVYDQGHYSVIPTIRYPVFDVTGAGDTVMAVFSLSESQAIPISDACHLANRAAGVVVGKVGCMPCAKEELLKALDLPGPK